MRNRERLRHAAIILRPYRAPLSLVIVLTVILAVISAVPALLSRNIVDRAIGAHDQELLWVLIAAMLINAVIYTGVSYAQGMLNARISQNITAKLRVRLVSQIYCAPLSALSGTASGDLLTRITNDVDGLDGIWSGPLVSILSNCAIIIVSLVFIAILSPPLALVAACLIPITALLVNRLSKKVYEVRMQNRHVRDLLARVVAETMAPAGLSFIKAFGVQESEAARVADIADELRMTDVQAAAIGLRFGQISTMSTMATPAVIWGIGYYLLNAHLLTLGGLFATVALILRLYSPATALATMQLQLSSAAAMFDRIVRYLELPSEEAAPDCQGLDSRPIHGPRHVAHQWRFSDVWFSYGVSGPEVLRSVNFQIQSGEFVILIGPSGAGKTSILHLFPRLFEPSKGVITLNGDDLRSFSVHELRKSIVYIAQDSFFLHDSIANNLRLASPGATNDELWRACHLAGLGPFLERLAGGLSTLVGDRGLALSGGQRQRLALARAFLRRPRTLILDEALSAVDIQTEQEILATLKSHFSGVTRLLVTHRTTSLPFADRVINIATGRVVSDAIVTNRDVASIA